MLPDEKIGFGEYIFYNIFENKIQSIKITSIFNLKAYFSEIETNKTFCFWLSSVKICFYRNYDEALFSLKSDGNVKPSDLKIGNTFYIICNNEILELKVTSNEDGIICFFDGFNYIEWKQTYNKLLWKYKKDLESAYLLYDILE